jgi:adenosylcobyric acid synthase
MTDIAPTPRQKSHEGTRNHGARHEFSCVGKSLLTAALCRIFADQGVSVAPFKSQNMSLNSSATMEGFEIGRAQALQAEAARIPASVHMNPILLKPAGTMTSQVVVRGKIWGRFSASDYHQRRVEELLPMVRESYEILAAKHEVIILEGAGSPAEINLKQHDIVNMWMAAIADAACLLVGDIDRRGVFASLLGTVQLLDATEQTRIRGFLINKFRVDIALLEPGVRMMEDRLRKPCLGVRPVHSPSCPRRGRQFRPRRHNWRDGAMAAEECACETTTSRCRCAAILFELHRLRRAAQ